MNKIVPFLLIFFFITGSFVTAFSPVSASDLVENSWTTKTPMSEPRWNMGVVRVDGKIYAIGGLACDGYSAGTNERYDPKTDKWTTLAPMPTPRESFTIFEYQNKIYCISGLVRVPDFGGFQMVFVDVTEVYDIATNKWRTISTSFNVGGDTYVINGQIFVLSFNQLYKYNVAADSWAVQTLPDGLSPFVCGVVVLDEKMFFICEKGNVGRGQGDKLVALAVYVYNSKTGEWSDGATGFAGSYGSIVGVTSGSYAPQKVYVFGSDWDMLPGEITFESFWPVTYVYDPVTDMWSTAMAPSALFDHCCVVNVDDILYVIGGSVNEQYVPIGHYDAVSNDHGSSNSNSPETAKPTISSTTKSSHTPYERFLTYIIVTILALTIGTIAMLFVYFKKRKRK